MWWFFFEDEDGNSLCEYIFGIKPSRIINNIKSLCDKIKSLYRTFIIILAILVILILAWVLYGT